MAVPRRRGTAPNPGIVLLYRMSIVCALLLRRLCAGEAGPDEAQGPELRTSSLEARASPTPLCRAYGATVLGRPSRMRLASQNLVWQKPLRRLRSERLEV